jgi:UPF0716 protein FxsA
MLGKLFLLFTLTTTLELFLLIELGKLMGLSATLGLILFTGFVGAWLAKREGLRTLATIRTDLAQGKMPGDSLMDGLAILIAGAFLLTPGVLTDLAGFLLLFPPTRALMKAIAMSRFEQILRQGVASGSVHVFGSRPGTIDAQFSTAAPMRAGAAEPASMPIERSTLQPEPDRVYRAGEIIDVTQT